MLLANYFLFASLNSLLTLISESLQHALIPEAENVADSEDSEDEWNYYRVGPNKEESVASAVAAEKVCKGVEELAVQEKNTVSIAKGSSEFTSPEIADDIKCEKLEKEISSSELVNIDVSISLHLVVVTFLSL